MPVYDGTIILSGIIEQDNEKIHFQYLDSDYLYNFFRPSKLLSVKKGIDISASSFDDCIFIPSSKVLSVILDNKTLIELDFSKNIPDSIYDCWPIDELYDDSDIILLHIP